MNKRIIQAYRVNDHGIMLESANPVHGLTSEFSDCVIGRGVCMADAMEDAFQQLSKRGINTVSVEVRMLQDMGYDIRHGWPTSPSIVSPLRVDHAYYVSIDYDLDPELRD